MSAALIAVIKFGVDLIVAARQSVVVLAVAASDAGTCSARRALVSALRAGGRLAIMVWPRH